MIMLVVCEYFRLMIIAQGVRDTLQDAVISTVTENYADVYHPKREGYSAAYQPVASDFEESINYGNIYSKMASVLSLSRSGTTYQKALADGRVEFSVHSLNVAIDNAPISAGTQTDMFEIDSYITLEVPVQFLGNILPNMTIRVKTSGGFTPIF